MCFKRGWFCGARELDVCKQVDIAGQRCRIESVRRFETVVLAKTGMSGVLPSRVVIQKFGLRLRNWNGFKGCELTASLPARPTQTPINTGTPQWMTIFGHVRDLE